MIDEKKQRQISLALVEKRTRNLTKDVERLQLGRERDESRIAGAFRKLAQVEEWYNRMVAERSAIPEIREVWRVRDAFGPEIRPEHRAELPSDTAKRLVAEVQGYRKALEAKQERIRELEQKVNADSSEFVEFVGRSGTDPQKFERQHYHLIALAGRLIEACARTSETLIDGAPPYNRMDRVEQLARQAKTILKLTE